MRHIIPLAQNHCTWKSTVLSAPLHFTRAQPNTMPLMAPPPNSVPRHQILYEVHEGSKGVPSLDVIRQINDVVTSAPVQSPRHEDSRVCTEKSDTTSTQDS